MLHARLDLHLLVPGKDHSDVDIPCVRLLLPEEVIDSCLYIGAQSSGLQPLGGKTILLSVSAG